MKKQKKCNLRKQDAHLVSVSFSDDQESSREALILMSPVHGRWALFSSLQVYWRQSGSILNSSVLRLHLNGNSCYSFKFRSTHFIVQLSMKHWKCFNIFDVSGLISGFSMPPVYSHDLSNDCTLGLLRWEYQELIWRNIFWLPWFSYL